MLVFAVGTMVAVMTINRWLKISFHALMAAIFAVIISVSFWHYWVLPLCLVVWLGVSWSRVTLSRHSFTEVVSGSALGCAVGFVFLWVVGGLPLP